MIMNEGNDQKWFLPRDLFLNGLRIGFRKQVEKTTGEVVGVRVGISQLVCDAVEEEVPPLGVHVHGQVLEDVHIAAVGNGADAGAGTLGSDVLYGLSTHVPRKRNNDCHLSQQDKSIQLT